MSSLKSKSLFLQVVQAVNSLGLDMNIHFRVKWPIGSKPVPIRQHLIAVHRLLLILLFVRAAPRCCIIRLIHCTTSAALLLALRTMLHCLNAGPCMLEHGPYSGPAAPVSTVQTAYSCTVHMNMEQSLTSKALNTDDRKSTVFLVACT